MEQLPPELLYFVLCKLDGASMGCAAGVCHRWRAVVTNLGRAFNVWFHVCMREVGLDAIIAQTGLTCLASKEGRTRAQSCNGQWEFWRALFVANHRCWRVDGKSWHVELARAWRTLHMEELDNERDEVLVTSITIPPCSHLGGGSKLCAGLNRGLLRNYSLADSSVEVNADGIVFGTLSVCPLSLHGCPGYRLESREEKSLILSCSPYNNMLLCEASLMNYSLFRDPASRVYCMSTLGPYYAVGTNASQREGVVVYRLRETREGEPGFPLGVCFQPVLKLRGWKQSNCMALALSHNQAVAGDHHGVIYHWRFDPLSRFDLMEEEGKLGAAGADLPETVNTCTRIMKLGYGVARLLFLQDSVVALTNRGEADIYVIDMDGGKMQRIRDVTLRSLAYNTASFATRLESCANLLAVGFSSGEVLVFNTRWKGWTSDLASHVVWRCRASVSRFADMTFTHGPTGPTLAVAGSSIHVFQWQQVGRRRRRDVRAKAKSQGQENVAKESSSSARDHIPQCAVPAAPPTVTPTENLNSGGVD